jgi:hypothetical protein
LVTSQGSIFYLGRPESGDPRATRGRRLEIKGIEDGIVPQAEGPTRPTINRRGNTLKPSIRRSLPSSLRPAPGINVYRPLKPFPPRTTQQRGTKVKTKLSIIKLIPNCTAYNKTQINKTQLYGYNFLT